MLNLFEAPTSCGLLPYWNVHQSLIPRGVSSNQPHLFSQLPACLGVSWEGRLGAFWEVLGCCGTLARTRDVLGGPREFNYLRLDAADP